MKRRHLEVADVFRAHGGEYLERFGKSASSAQKTVLRNISQCRTALLGGHLTECDRCGHQEISYNSCRDRHCPKCQGADRAQWLRARAADLLPTGYFHVVFTIPQEIAPLALQNKKVIYDILFAAAWKTLREIAAEPKHLGAQIGCLAVLHTWGQNVLHHPHLHCIVPGGGLAPDRSRWISCRRGFFLPVRVLSRLFRGKFLHLLKRAFAGGKLSFHGKLEDLSVPAAFGRLIDSLYEKEWVVYAKPPFGSATQVLKYLARYTHRVAISSQRLISLRDGKVTFSYKDYARGNRKRTMTLDASEFIRRFLMHVLPSGFVRIRHYGFLSNRSRKSTLPLCRELLAAAETAAPREESPAQIASETEDFSARRCPACKKGHMLVVEKLAPTALDQPRLQTAAWTDSS
jgi:hypothetical protein